MAAETGVLRLPGVWLATGLCFGDGRLEASCLERRAESLLITRTKFFVTGVDTAIVGGSCVSRRVTDGFSWRVHKSVFGLVIWIESSVVNVSVEVSAYNASGAVMLVVGEELSPCLFESVDVRLSEDFFVSLTSVF